MKNWMTKEEFHKIKPWLILAMLSISSKSSYNY